MKPLYQYPIGAVFKVKSRFWGYGVKDDNDEECYPTGSCLLLVGWEPYSETIIGLKFLTPDGTIRQSYGTNGLTFEETVKSWIRGGLLERVYVPEP